MKRKILVMGLPGAGKTTFSLVLTEILNAVHFNADEVRANINKDLGFSVEDRIEQARRMGWLCDQVVKSGTFVIADFVCPTEETRKTFNADYTIWIDRIKKSEYEDTNLLFEEPTNPDLRVHGDYFPIYWAGKAREAVLK